MGRMGQVIILKNQYLKTFYYIKIIYGGSVSEKNSDELIKKVTGEKLNIEYFKNHLVERYLN